MGIITVQSTVLFNGVVGLGHHINDGNGSIVESDFSEVGGAGGKGLVTALSRVHLQDGDEDVDVGDAYDNHCDHNDGTRRDGGDNSNDGDI